MKIAVIDADLIGRNKHRFPNLACMKISSYHKKLGDEVTLELSYDNLEDYDKVYISKVFTDTPIPEGIEKLTWVECGGTGFFFDKAPNLPYDIEHSFPDYHLYDSFIESKFIYDEESGKILNRSEFKEYLDYSIGFITRGCFRKCGFCVNKKYDRVFKHSPLEEFYDPNRKKICLLDDNFLGHADWKAGLEELIATGKPFKFKQGLDERLLTPEKCELLFNSKYDSDITFAFDKIEDYRLIEKKLQMIRQYTERQIVFYVLCGYDDNEKYDEDFWKQDLINTFERIELLGRYRALPYIMRFNKYHESPYRGIYITLARWCNQFSFFKKKSFYEYCIVGGKSSIRYFEKLERDYPEIAERYCYKKYWYDENGGNKC